jgi:methionyl-tRNA synthetase
MSKTLGTGIDPTALAGTWGADAVRYWLLHEVPPTDDADYTEARFRSAYVSDLANDLGNLLQRTISMVHRYRDGVVPTGTPSTTSTLQATAADLPAALHRALGDGWDPRLALDAILAVVRCANRSIEDAKPWALARAERDGDRDARRRLDALLQELAEGLRVVAEALRPFLPETAARMAAQLGVAPAANWIQGLRWGDVASGTRVAAAEPLFPKPP